MNSEELKEKEDIAGKEVSKRLQEEKDIESKYEAVEQRRRAALKNDNWEKETALLDEEKKPLARQLERARIFVADSKAKFSEIRELREKTEEEEAAKREQYLKEKDLAECEAICIDAPNFVNAIGDLYAELCEKVARFQLNILRVVSKDPPSLKTMEQSKLTLIHRIDEIMANKGLLPFAEGAGFFEISPYLKPDPKYLKENPNVIKSISYVGYGKWLYERWVEEKTEEWRKENGL